LVPGGFLEDTAEWVETFCVSRYFAQNPLAAVFRHHAQKVEVEVQFLQTLAHLYIKPQQNSSTKVRESHAAWKEVLDVFR
jgi:hypothetical protein